jgi:hypothetical protein
MTMITVQRPSAGRPARVLFNMFQRPKGGGDPFFRPTPNPDVNGLCYQCHPNGIREISPLGFHVNPEEQASGRVAPEAEWRAALEMNNSMELNNGFKTSDWGTGLDAQGHRRPLVNPDSYGPAYGPIHPLTRTTTPQSDGSTRVEYPTRSESFINSCAQSRTEINLQDIFGRAGGKNNIYRLTPTPAINWQRVADAMNCASCHNGRIRGTLNSRTEVSTIEFKILVDQSMPVGHHRDPLAQGSSTTPVADELNPNERIALANCLEAEFAQESRRLKEWLEQVSCSANANVAAGTDPSVTTGASPRPDVVPAQGPTGNGGNGAASAAPPTR